MTARPSLPGPPAWVSDLVAADCRPWLADGDDWLRWQSGSSYSLISVCVDGAEDLEERPFRDCVRAAYQRVASLLDGRHPVRLWNFIPSILEPLGDMPHRYMAFNAGRFEALSGRHGRNGFEHAVATATGVGHDGGEFLVHCLSADGPGRPVENPRQVSAYRYSRRYGPRPPCFARATRLQATNGSRPLLLVGGTASVRGEDSVHLGDLQAQLGETLDNLSAVVRAGAGAIPVPGPLARFRHLRAYYVDPDHRHEISQQLAERLPEAETELMQAELCRPELLVEIEGVAQLPAASDAFSSERTVLAGA